jgi:hypothetical protein
MEAKESLKSIFVIELHENLDLYEDQLKLSKEILELKKFLYKATYKLVSLEVNERFNHNFKLSNALKKGQSINNIVAPNFEREVNFLKSEQEKLIDKLYLLSKLKNLNLSKNNIESNLEIIYSADKELLEKELLQLKKEVFVAEANAAIF